MGYLMLTRQFEYLKCFNQQIRYFSSGVYTTLARTKKAPKMSSQALVIRAKELFVQTVFI